MKSNMSRAAVALLAVATLGLTAACGGGGDAQDANGTGTKPSRQATQAADDAEGAAALTATQLEKAALAEGDVKGYKVEKTPEADMPAVAVPAEPAACQPIADMLLFTSDPKAEARVGRTLTTKDELDATVPSLALLAYEESDAEKVVGDLRTATEKCTEFEHTDYKYSGVKALTAPELGDEAVSYKLKGSIEGTTVPMAFTVVRSGSTLAAFYALNALDEDKARVPDDVVEAQLTKLKRVSG
ncbi:hypothetical protein [Streptomyces sp. NPDC002845]